ncbi:MAG: hypothetical protein ACRD21_21355, partial [Vicinamibacteria bacterium]
MMAAAEVIRLNNGDVIHGTLVAANNTEVRLKTPYGELTIPKKDIDRIDYEGSGGGGDPAPERPRVTSTAGPVSGSTAATGDRDRAALRLQILGRSFWYAFDSPPEAPRDASIRLRVYVGSDRACTFVDAKPDTVDGVTLYNSFTFSPTDSQLVESLEGYDCRVEKAGDGAVVLRVGLSPGSSSGLQTVRMLYEVNEGTARISRWIDAVSRSFSVQVAPGKEAVVLLEQNADALEYTGFFKKTMKNVELFQL